jgi:hypothetical protein
VGDLLSPEFGYSCDQVHGNGLGEREAECAAVVELVWRDVVLERLHKVSGYGVERVVLFPPSEIDHGFAA